MLLDLWYDIGAARITPPTIGYSIFMVDAITSAQVGQFTLHLRIEERNTTDLTNRHLILSICFRSLSLKIAG